MNRGTTENIGLTSGFTGEETAHKIIWRWKCQWLPQRREEKFKRTESEVIRPQVVFMVPPNANLSPYVSPFPCKLGKMILNSQDVMGINY